MNIKELALFLGLNEQEASILKERGEKLGLDPVAGQINLLKRRKNEKDKNGNDNWVTVYSFQVGIEGFRLIAERSSNYDGQDPIEYVVERNDTIVRTDVTLAADKPIAAIAKIYRKGINRPFVNVAHYRDYVATTNQGAVTSMWKKWTIMLAKCAEAAAFRKGFSELDFGGVYEAAEIPPDDVNGTDAHPQQGKEPPWAEDDRKNAAAKAAEAAEKNQAKQPEASPADAPAAPAPPDKAAQKPEEAVKPDTKQAQAAPPKQEAKSSTGKKDGGVKMADPNQINAIKTLAKKKGIDYNPAALAELTFEAAAQEIKNLNAVTRVKEAA